ncbi:MAG: hypothetical protein ACK4N4_01950 [Burkholderiales bacterium]
MRFLLLLPLCAALSGCYVAIGGHQAVNGGATTTTTGAATRLDARVGSATIGASFGAPAAPHAPGGRVALSRGAAALLFLGLVAVDAANHLAARFGSAPAPAAKRESIAATCSCYGGKSGLTPLPPPE